MKAKRYRSTPVPAPELLHLFIEKTVVNKPFSKYSRTAEQNICIYCRGIGLMDETGKRSEMQGGKTTESDPGLEKFCRRSRCRTCGMS